MNTIAVRKKTAVDVQGFLPGYRPAIAAFIAWQGSQGTRNYDSSAAALRALVNQADQYLRQDQGKPATIALHRIALKQFIIRVLGADHSQPVKALVDQEYAHVYKIERDKAVKPGKYLKRHEVERLIQECPQRYSLIIKTLFITGLRVSELCGILVKNCAPSGDHVNVTIIGKRSKERIVQVPEKLFRDLRRFFIGREYLFCTCTGRKLDRRNIYKELERHAGRIIGRPVHPHMLRHSLASYLINEKNINLGAVSKLLGHSRQSLTADLYCHGLPAFEMLFDAAGELK